MLQYAEVELSRKLDDGETVTGGGWFFLRRSSGQYFLFATGRHGHAGVAMFVPQGKSMLTPM